MAVRLKLGKVYFFGGVAAAIFVGQSMGLLSGGGTDVSLSSFESGENTMVVTSDDKSMEAYVAEAQMSLHKFLAHAQTDRKNWESVTIKVALEGDTMIENIWVSDFRTEGAAWTGRLANDPVDLPGRAAGDSVTFGTDQIVDWAFVEDGKGYGFYTVRAMMGSMPEDQASQLAAFLSDPAMPADW